MLVKINANPDDRAEVVLLYTLGAMSLIFHNAEGVIVVLTKDCYPLT